MYVQLEIVMIKRHARPTKCENHGHLALEFRCRPFILKKKMEKIVVLLISVYSSNSTCECFYRYKNTQITVTYT